MYLVKVGDGLCAALLIGRNEDKAAILFYERIK
jgi:hypothetical protein